MRAKALKLVPDGCCVTCGQTLRPGPRRKCGACGKPILRGHKFFFEGSTIRHRICDDPKAYVREKSA